MLCVVVALLVDKDLTSDSNSATPIFIKEKFSGTDTLALIAKILGWFSYFLMIFYIGSVISSVLVNRL